MAIKKPRGPNSHARPGRGSFLAVALAVALLLVGAQPSLAISGFATDGAAVQAQYPDAAASRPGAKPMLASLSDIVRVQRVERASSGPKAVAARHALARKVARKAATAALSSSVGIDPRQSGSIGLLSAAMAVLGVGAFLRWRRGLEQG